MKPLTKIAAVLFGIMALVHVYRLISPFKVEIAGIEIPVMVSTGIALIGLAFFVGLWRESNR
jgi:predicted MFS family arabinose efflux permease